MHLLHPASCIARPSLPYPRHWRAEARLVEVGDNLAGDLNPQLAASLLTFPPQPGIHLRATRRRALTLSIAVPALAAGRNGTAHHGERLSAILSPPVVG
ncbi:hypothetical protein CBS147321_7273 [Aspergillus niger]|nr:hypothetical protein CBS147321_7273 [Aspergillus niger]KAI2951312.1 hypothetical protein CBS147322_5054 [Aspergillus niger]KAI3021255.1 hypothetical protein CBS147482_1877 [Aspergillus niger]